jgi:hypothetical protein
MPRVKFLAIFGCLSIETYPKSLFSLVLSLCGKKQS